MNKELLKKLNNLRQEVRPNQTWVTETRDILLTQIKSQTQLDLGGRFSAWQKFARNLLTMAVKPVGAFVLTIGIILSSYIATVGASKNSVPGDILYPIKITSERAQINLAGKKEKKAALEMEFAKRRIAEMDKIIKKTETDKKTDTKIKIALTLDKYKENIQNVKLNLEYIKKEEPAKAVKLAEEVDTKSAELTQNLETKKDEVQPAAQEAIKEAITATKETNTTAVGIMVTQHQEGQITEDQKGEVEKKVDDKLVKLSEAVTLAETKLTELKMTEKALADWYAAELEKAKAPVPENKIEPAPCTENCSTDYTPETAVPQAETPAAETATPADETPATPAATDEQPVASTESAPAVEPVVAEPKVIASIADAKLALEEAKKLLEGGEVSKAYNDDIKLVSDYLDKLNDLIDKYTAYLAKAQAAAEPAAEPTKPAEEIK